jgi:hypothetical protein
MFEYIEKGPRKACVICGTQTNKLDVESSYHICCEECFKELKKEGFEYAEDLGDAIYDDLNEFPDDDTFADEGNEDEEGTTEDKET